MNSMTLKNLLLVTLFLPLLGQAQGLKSLAPSNLSGIYGTLANPANAVGGIDRYSFNLVGVSVRANTNALRTDLEYDLLRIVGRRPIRLEQGRTVFCGYR